MPRTTAALITKNASPGTEPGYANVIYDTRNKITSMEFDDWMAGLIASSSITTAGQVWIVVSYSDSLICHGTGLFRTVMKDGKLVAERFTPSLDAQSATPINLTTWPPRK